MRKNNKVKQVYSYQHLKHQRAGHIGAFKKLKKTNKYMKQSYLTVTDQFCGAGGSSQGVRNASKRIKGLEVKLAMNHWQLAVDTHNTNFPEAMHDCADVSASDPRRYPSTDILITSPECTNQTLAKGIKFQKAQMDLFKMGKVDAAAERSRATMWDVCRFAEYHKYNNIIVENVVEARNWLLWGAWLKAMDLLGYEHECVYRNSMHFHPTPQSRDRMYVVFWRKGNKKPDLNYTPMAYCSLCSCDISAIQVFKNNPFGKYRKQYVYKCPKHALTVEPYYYASVNCIDWSLPGTRIVDRSKPLSDNTQRRIDNALEKFKDEQFIILRGIERSLLQPAFTQTTFTSQVLVQPPFIINNQYSTGIDFRVKSTSAPINTITTSPGYGLVTPPFIIKGEHTTLDGYYKSVTEPFQTQTTRQTMGLVTTDSFKAFLSYYYSGYDQSSSMLAALGTVTTRDRVSLVQYNKPNIEDCYYRMLRANEIKLAMAFDRDYVVLGSEKDQVKQCGNAVTPPVMEWLVEQCAKSLN